MERNTRKVSCRGKRRSWREMWRWAIDSTSFCGPSIRPVTMQNGVQLEHEWPKKWKNPN
jgi:hypothetical protein